MAKKQNVIEKEFTLDLSNISKIAKKEEIPSEKIKPGKVEEKAKAKPRPKAKQDEKNRVVPIPETKAEVDSKKSNSLKKHLRLVVSKDHITEFESLFKRFVEETETYWVNTSRVHLFVLGALYLEQKYKKSNKYHNAPEDFVNFISRKGNRPKTEESSLRKQDATPMFFEVDESVFEAYYNVIYSFLVEQKDVHNLSYSASYFFKDFLDLLQGSFKTFCAYGRKHS